MLKLNLGEGAETDLIDKGYIYIDNLSDYTHPKFSPIEMLQKTINGYGYKHNIQSLIKEGKYIIRDCKTLPYEDESVDEIFSYSFLGKYGGIRCVKEALRVLKKGKKLFMKESLNNKPIMKLLRKYKVKIEKNCNYDSDNKIFDIIVCK